MEYLKLIPAKYHSEFIKLTETGEASDEFLDFVDSNEDCQKALDIIIEEMVREIMEFFEKAEGQEQN